jgi:hypothetical protein
MIPSLQEYSDKKAKENLKGRLLDYSLGFISAVLIALLAWLLTKAD